MKNTPSYHTYFISSLPMLNFDMKLPLTFDKFIEMCAQIVPDFNFNDNQPTLRKYKAFDRALRNELVKIRASRKKIPDEKYLRDYEYSSPQIVHIAISAHRETSPVEAEKMLDRERWRFLDELSFEHYFDNDFLAIYAQKLLLLQRWRKIQSADEVSSLKEVLV